jgi:hypothetical protein
MSKASVSTVGRVAFELDRFELVGGDRCELQGRWFGVRGRRFMRPSLTIVVDGQSTRLLADLADKPWAAEDGEPWRAAFACPVDGDDLLEAELTVGPDVTIVLPAPNRRAGTAKKRPSRGRTDPSRLLSGRRSSGPSPVEAPPVPDQTRPSRRKPPTSSDAESGDLMRDLAGARTELRRLQRQLDQAEAAKVQAAARLEEAAADLAAMTRERDTAQAAHDRMVAEHEFLRQERDGLAGELDTAQRERDEFATECDAARRTRDEAVRASQTADAACRQAVAERDAALAGRDTALADRDAAVAQRDTAVVIRDTAVAERDAAVVERDAAVAARDEARAERTALSRTNERLESELADLLSARGAAMVMRRAAQEHPASRSRVGLLPVAIAAIVVLAIVLAIVLHVV